MYSTVSDLDLMRLRADILFRHDERGRMICSNEPDARPAPRLFLGYTTSGYVVRFGHTVSDELALRLVEIVDRAPPVDDLHLSPTLTDALRQELERHAPIGEETHGPAYRFPEIIPETEEAVQLTAANVELTRYTFPWLIEELADWWPCFAVVLDGAAVSVCFSSRIGQRAAEAGVDTLPDYRRRGHASAVTAAWAVAVRGDGRIPLYSTAWDNRASQGVARRLGLIMFGADVTWE